MRIKVVCLNTARDVSNDGKSIVYSAKFGVLKVPGQQVMLSGNLNIQSTEQLHYKPLKKYRIDLDEDSGIVTPGQA